MSEQEFLEQIKSEYSKFKKTLRWTIAILSVFLLSFIAKDIWTTATLKTEVKNIKEDYVRYSTFSDYISSMANVNNLRDKMHAETNEKSKELEDKFNEAMQKLHDVELLVAQSGIKVRSVNGKRN